MTSPTDGAIATSEIDTAGVEVEETGSLAALARDIAIQRHRIKAVADKSESGTAPATLDALTVMRELHSNILPLMTDFVGFVERLEEHASWASDQITDLQDESETASQLNSEDAAKLRTFLSDVGTRLGHVMVPDGLQREGLADLVSRSVELIELVDEIELTRQDDDDAQGDDEPQPAPEPTPIAAVPASPPPSNDPSPA